MFYFVQSVNLCLIKSCKKLNWSFYHFDDVLVIKCNMRSVIERYCSTFSIDMGLVFKLKIFIAFLLFDEEIGFLFVKFIGLLCLVHLSWGYSKFLN